MEKKMAQESSKWPMEISMMVSGSMESKMEEECTWMLLREYYIVGSGEMERNKGMAF